MHILVVEDHAPLARNLADGLEQHGHSADFAADGAHGLQLALEHHYDLVILDLALPRMDGLEVCRQLRARQARRVPVLMLTARDALHDKLEGFGSGADDYLVKPFELDELCARLRAVMRRHGGRAQPVLSHGGVTLDPSTRQVTRDGVPVLLSAREFAVLEALMQRPGALLSRAQLEDRLYGWGEEIESNAVSVYIHQLRRKLGAGFIGNMRGVGYFVGPAPGDGAP